MVLGFFLSGAAGLMYEIVWVRMLGLIFGHTVHAVTTVLVAFMGGLALGSLLCSRRVDRIGNLLVVYAWLEIAIGAYALLTPSLIEAVRSAYLSYARSYEPSFGVLTLVQFVLSTAVLVVPAGLMGATFPLLSRFVVQGGGPVGRRVGALYAWNTLGAVAGTYLVGFHLLPALGMRLTLLVTAGLSVAVGVGMLGAARLWRDAARVVPAAPPAAGVAASPTPDPRHARVLLLGAALSGGVAMIYELAWTRALALVIGSTTYAFTAILLSFLIGIAGGSAWASRRAARGGLTPGFFAALQTAAALGSLGVLALVDRLPDVFLWGFTISREPGFIVALQIGLSVAVMLIPTWCLGAALPCAIHLLGARGSGVGRSVGRAYASNTGGAIVGAFAAGFVLIPLLGVQNTIRAAIAANLFIGWFVVLAFSARAGWAAAWAPLAGAVVLVLVPNWDPVVMSSGVSTYADYYTRGGGSWRHRIEDRVLFYQDGISSTVSVHQGGDERTLRVNGKADAGTGKDMRTQLLLGHLPVLLHPRPRAALVIGLGSGVTVGALTRYDTLERIDVVEIEPAVIVASSFFDRENRHALADRRVRTIVADGRTLLATAPDRYDLIISEPSNPWVGGVATLFTVESFGLARSRLTPDGVMAQWVHSYAMAPEDFQMIVASFHAAFPYMSLWAPVPGDFILIGTSRPQLFDLDRVAGLLAGNASLRTDWGLNESEGPEAILRTLVLNHDELARFAAGAALNTDDLLPLEFSAPRNLYRDTLGLNQRWLQGVIQSRPPALMP